MPVTVRLSQLFVDRMGEELADELVRWFNQVDATYRNDLRELNELNFARFDARLEQRLAELRADLEVRIERVHTTLDSKIERVAAELHAKIDRVAGEFTAKLDASGSELRATVEQRFGEQARWLFAAWASLLIPIIGLWMRG